MKGNIPLALPGLECPRLLFFIVIVILSKLSQMAICEGAEYEGMFNKALCWTLAKTSLLTLIYLAVDAVVPGRPLVGIGIEFASWL